MPQLKGVDGFQCVADIRDGDAFDAEQTTATRRGVVVGGIDFSFLAHKFHASQGVVFESASNLISFAIGVAFLGAWFELRSLSPVFWLLERMV